MKLQMHSEEFAPTGGIGGEGATRALGRPHLSRLEVLVREAIQNSLDARASAKQPVHFSIEYRELERRELKYLRDTVFTEAPEEAHLPLAGAIGSNPVEVLFICDRGTKGLQGPTRTNELQSEDDPRNFIDFFRNIGRFGDQPTGGGTYGFGKGSLYVASAARTILVHTRVRTQSGLKSRLMGAALGPQFSQRSSARSRLRPYTGRHWWGIRAEDGVVDPVEGTTADRIAASLGFPEFEEGQSGTTIMVVAPELALGSNGLPASESARAAGRAALAERMRQVLMWYCWPHMIATPSSRLIWKVKADGREVSGPDVDDHPILRTYAGAYRALSRSVGSLGPGSALKVSDVECHRPVQHLGRLALARTFARGIRAEREEDEGGGGKTLESIPDGTPRHVALMRAPRLIVRYEEYAAPADGSGFVGVFLADDGLNTAFAEAEPVTHDEWHPNYMQKGHARTFVKVALTRISDQVRTYLAPATAEEEGRTDDSQVGMISRSLASLIPGVAGPGAETQHVGIIAPGRAAGDGREPGGARTKVGGTRGESLGNEGFAELAGSPTLSSEDGETVATFEIRFKNPHTKRPLHVRCEPRVLTADGATEREVPQGAAMPSVKRWTGDSVSRIADDGTVELQPLASGTIWVTVSMPDNAAMSVDVHVVRTMTGAK